MVSVLNHPALQQRKALARHQVLLFPNRATSGQPLNDLSCIAYALLVTVFGSRGLGFGIWVGVL